MTNDEDSTFPPMTGHICETGMGRIRLDQLLGQGGFGAVYEAVALDAPGEPHYAVKIVARNPAHDDAQAREIALHGAVSSHPNVVDIHYAEVFEDFLFVVLGLCTGGSLMDRLNRGEFQGEDAAEKIKDVFGQLLNAVEYCHDEGVFHRDLKPENVLVEGEGDGMHVLLTDFGLSSDKEFVQSYRCGTSLFWSPECQADMGASIYSLEANDVWSLGVILLLMITNHYAWEVASPKDHRFQAFLDNPKRTQAVLKVSDEAWELLQKVFTLDGSERLTIPELREALQAIESFSSGAKLSTRECHVEVESSQSQELAVYVQSAANSVQESVECGFGEDDDDVCLLKDILQSGLVIQSGCFSGFVC